MAGNQKARLAQHEWNNCCVRRFGFVIPSLRSAAPMCCRGLYSSVVERQSCKLKVLGSIPSGGFGGALHSLPIAHCVIEHKHAREGIMHSGTGRVIGTAFSTYPVPWHRFQRINLPTKPRKQQQINLSTKSPKAAPASTCFAGCCSTMFDQYFI